MRKNLLVVLLTGMIALLIPFSGMARSFDQTKDISVVSREEGSGTRGAFIELFGIEQKNSDGKKIDHTTDEATITNNTNVMMTTVAGDPYAIGYVSLGSLNDTVKAVKIDGVEPTVANVIEGKYKISRPFHVAYRGTLSAPAADFLAFILSEEGQAIVEKTGYIKVGNPVKFQPSNPTGKVVVGGSSSVTPVMEKLKEAYQVINPNLTIEVQMSDSTTGMKSAIDGIVDIGMASRDVKDSEKEAGLTPVVIARDGLAVIVNHENPIESISAEQVQKVYIGELTNWKELQ